MDAVDRIAVDIRAHPADERCGGLVAPAHRRRPVDRRRWQAPMRQLDDLGKDDDAGRGTDRHLAAEEAERVAGPDAQRAKAIAPSPGQRHLRQPLPRAARRDPDHAAGQAGGQGRLVPAFDPWLPPSIVVLDPVDGLQHLPDVGARVQDSIVGAHVTKAASRVQPRADADGSEQVGEEEEEFDPGAECGDDERGAKEEKAEVVAQQPHDAVRRSGCARSPRPPRPRPPAPTQGSRGRSAPDQPRAGTPGS